ncbi:MAG: sensor histidine kinase [Eubacteriales bacterium]|nr:sensor histidine kinase [Eubacteriales bacterium]
MKAENKEKEGISMKSFIRNMKIHNKMMICFLAVCLIPVTAVGTLVYNFSARNLEEASMEFVSIFNSQIVSNLNNFLDEYDRVTKSILADEKMITSLGSENDSLSSRIDQQIYLRKVMMRMVAMKPDIEGIAMVTRYGDFYQFNQENASMDWEKMTEQSWYQDILECEETLYITEAHDCSYYDRQQDRIVVTIARKIYDYAGKYIGMVLLHLDSSELVELNNDFLLARNNYNIMINVINKNNGILYDSRVSSGQITWQQIVEKKSPLHDKDTEDYIVMSNETERGYLKVNAIIPRSRLLMKIEKIQYVTVIGLVVCAGLAAAISWLLSRTLSKPMKDLQKSMKQVEKGNYQVMLQGESEDEMGCLIRSYNNMVRQIKVLIEDVYLAEIKQRNAEYLALQTQINPHMLYNTLESIRMKALMQGADETAEMIKTLSRMFRMALDRKKSVCTIQDEIEYTKTYVQLLNIRYKDRVSLRIDIPEEIRSHSIISLVFQPIVENCIEHGFRNRRSSLHVVIRGEFTQEQDVRLEIRDDGCGMSPERLAEINARITLNDQKEISATDNSEKKKTSIGLKNIAERIYLHYGQQGSLKIVSSDEQGTMVEIRIPQEEKV